MVDIEKNYLKKAYTKIFTIICNQSVSRVSLFFIKWIHHTPFTAVNEYMIFTLLRIEIHRSNIRGRLCTKGAKTEGLLALYLPECRSLISRRIDGFN